MKVNIQMRALDKNSRSDSKRELYIDSIYLWLKCKPNVINYLHNLHISKIKKCRIFILNLKFKRRKKS